MSIKKFAQRLINQKTDGLILDHGMPTTRRQLLERGFYSCTATVAMPSLLSLMARDAYGQEGCSSEGAGGDGSIPLIIYDNAGGWNAPGRNFVVGGANGDPLGPEAYGTLGVNPDGYEAQVVNANREFGVPLNPLGAFGVAMMDNTAPETRARVNGFNICTISNDDTGNNPLSPAYLVGAMTRGEITTIVGSESSNTGGRSAAPGDSINPAIAPVRVRNAQDARNLVVPGTLVQLFGLKGVEKIMAASRNMSQSQLAAFHKKSADEQLRALIDCANVGGVKQLVGFNADNVDPENDQIISNVFQNNNELGAIAKLALDGYAKVGVFQKGGMDYHGANAATQVGRDREVGQDIAALMEAAVQKGQDMMIAMITDGGTSCRANKPEDGANNSVRTGGSPTSDSGERSLISVFMIKGSGEAARPTLINEKFQIGEYQVNGTIKNDVNKASNSPAFAARVVAGNWLSFNGREAEIKAATGEDLMNDDDQYIVAAKA